MYGSQRSHQDEFVQDCGQGLDWASVAGKYWCHFVFLWALVSWICQKSEHLFLPGLFVAITGCSVVLLADGLEVWRVLLYASSLLPLLYLCYLSVRLFAQGASLSERCKQIPAFVNQLSMRHDGADPDRRYLVKYMSNSAAGFTVHGVTLSQSVLVEQMFWVAAVCYGIMGVLLRRYP